MTLEQIRMFVAVAELGSIVKAAETMHKTQPALSIAIKRLQEELQLTLLEKQHSRLQLTKAGQKLLRHFRFLLKQQDTIVSVAAHLAQGNETQIEVVADSLCDQTPLFDALPVVQQAFPLTEILLSYEHHLGALKRIIDGNADIAITPWLQDFYELGEFETVPFSTFEVITVVHARHVKARNNAIKSAEDLIDLPMVLPQKLVIDVDLEKVMGYVSASQIRPNDLHAQKRILLNGIGWGYIPRSAVEDELASGELVQLDLNDITCTLQGETRLIKLATRYLGPTAQLFWDELAKRASLHTLSSQCIGYKLE